MVDDVGGDSVRVEEGGCAVCIEDGGEVEVAVAVGEIAKESNAIVEAKCGLGDDFVLA
jgi:hypothetical protein